MSMKKLIFAIVLLLVSQHSAWSQIAIGNDDEFSLDYNKPKQYEIGGITVSGIKFLDNYALIKLTGLEVGDKIQVPGDKISGAIKKLWVQGLFDDIQINVSKIDGELIFFDIVLKERPRLSRFSFDGIKKSEADDIRERIKLVSGKVVNDNLINNTKNNIEKSLKQPPPLRRRSHFLTEPFIWDRPLCCAAPARRSSTTNCCWPNWSRGLPKGSVLSMASRCGSIGKVCRSGAVFASTRSSSPVSTLR